MAAALVLEPSSVEIPFSVGDLPDNLLPATITQDLAYGSTKVILSPGGSGADTARTGYVIAVLRSDDAAPTGRPVTVGGLEGLLDDSHRESRSWCLPQQHRFLCVQTDSNDYGPLPDRSGDEDTVLGIAAALRPAADLTDQTTWFRADEVFG